MDEQRLDDFSRAVAERLFARFPERSTASASVQNSFLSLLSHSRRSGRGACSLAHEPRYWTTFLNVCHDAQPRVRGDAPGMSLCFAIARGGAPLNLVLLGGAQIML